jgi:hypothetical protein
MNITFAICAYNRAGLLDQTLARMCQVRNQGVPPGPQLLGMPRRLVRKYLEVLARSCYYRLTFRRVRHLQCAPEHWTNGAC